MSTAVQIQYLYIKLSFISSYNCFSLLFMHLDGSLECLLKQFIYILACRRRGLIILKSFFLSISDSFCILYFSDLVIGFVSQQEYDSVFHIYSIAFHSVLPSADILERLPTTHIEHEQHNLRVLKKRITNLFIIRAATDIKEVYSNCFIVHIYFLYTIIDSNCRYIFIYEFAFAVSLYNT